MKFLTSILSLYILILTIIPCVDAVRDNAVQKIEISPDSAQNLPVDIDQCSPFCTCNCCVTPIVLQNYIIQFTCFYYTQSLLSQYAFNYLSSDWTSIWQPPQIS